MYGIRSALIHHGKEISFETEDLRKLQMSAASLILVLVEKSNHYETKQSLLNEIDEAIIGAY